MSAQSIFKSYIVLYKLLERGRFPSLSILEKSLSDQGFNSSPKTIKRYLTSLRDEFGLDICYDHKKKGYFIKEIDKTNGNAFIKLLELFESADIIREALQGNPQYAKHIFLDTIYNSNGTEWIKDLLYAIQNKTSIEVAYRKFGNSEAHTYYLHPLCIKEFQNRWYLLGTDTANDNLKTFGLERIEQLSFRETFVRDSENNFEEFFGKYYGVTFLSKSEEDILISSTPFQANYFKNLPLHPSQELIEENSDQILFRYRLIPTYEFYQKILMYNHQIKVLQPTHLKDTIQELLQKTLENY